MTLAESARRAVLPWNSLDALTIEALPQQEIDICLLCTYHADACDRCDGKGNLAKDVGRPKKEIDITLLREMLKLKRCNKEMCAALHVSEATLIKAKKEIMNND